MEANAAEINAANAARKLDGKAEIIFLTSERDPAYSQCGLPYVLAGEIPSLKISSYLYHHIIACDNLVVFYIMKIQHDSKCFALITILTLE